MSNNKRSIVLPRLETVEEGGILMSDLKNRKRNAIIFITISIMNIKRMKSEIPFRISIIEIEPLTTHSLLNVSGKQTIFVKFCVVV